MSGLTDHLDSLGFTGGVDDDGDPVTEWVYRVGEFTIRVKVGDWVWVADGTTYGTTEYRTVKPSITVDLPHQCDEWTIVGNAPTADRARAAMLTFADDAREVTLIVGLVNLSLPHPVGEVMS